MMAARLLGTSSRIAKFSRHFHTAKAAFLPVVQFKLSDIGEGIAEVQVKEWYVKEGDTISQFDKVCEVQSDKAAVTISSRYDGIVRKLYHDVDGMARVGQALIDVEVEGNVEEDEKPKKEEKKGAVTSTPQASKESATSASESSASDGKVLATPAVRRLAMENKVKLSSVRGSGKEGRVLKEDVLKFLGQVPADHSSGSTNIRTTHQAPLPAAKSYEALKEDVAVPIRGYTRAMIKTMTEALKIPHFGYNDEINVDALVKLRGELKDFAKERHVKLSYMPFFIKAASLALFEFPGLNATTDDKLENIIHKVSTSIMVNTQKLILKASHNICLAMDTPGGLVVPNIKNCEQRSIFEIAQEITRLMEAGKRQQIGREDLVGGTFTLSNIGAIGGTYASPVIFPPQVAIGAIGAIERLPRFDKHDNVQLNINCFLEIYLFQVIAANVIKVSWCADHRVVDGATMARFGNRWKFYLEHPSAMLAQLK
ncbi:Protein CBG03281 [Caenorhabditis briggsae]|uniref:Dihydrolipoamide acetyltransferase component of pyruvate dehydrogenase complex n=1 Tax=Caenorhabditis briggsae TaxID=6238 RepID=A8WSE0_CAEBR|nr:Protein CBG03281 [Caenorhabditis briggsae]CAP23399.2 Protein CBG03281 [Caenorhabditis briggsae]